MPPAEGIEIALLAAALLGRLRQEQKARVVEVRTFVEMTLERTRQKTHVVLLQFRPVLLVHEPILLVDDAVIGQDLDGLAPCRMYGLVFGGGYGVQLRQLDLEGHRDVRLFGEDAAVLDGQQRKFRFERRYFKYVSHSSLFYG